MILPPLAIAPKREVEFIGNLGQSSMTQAVLGDDRPCVVAFRTVLEG